VLQHKPMAAWSVWLCTASYENLWQEWCLLCGADYFFTICLCLSFWSFGL